MNYSYDGDESAAIKRSKVLTVYYDGGCPICAREIGMYRSLRGAESIKWVNLSELPDGEIAHGVTKKDALARLHAIDHKGNIHVGGAAFAALWRMLPKFRMFGALCTRWPFRAVLHHLYILFLVLRPFLQAISHASSKFGKRVV